MGLRIHSLGGYIHEYQRSVVDPGGFWGAIADAFFWRKRWERVLDWDAEIPRVSWFSGGRLNITENIFERRLFTDGDRPAIIWEPNDATVEPARTLTYRQLHAAVCQCANALSALGVSKGDRVIIYLPMVPEAAVAMLACARLGAVHSVVFAGFSAQALADRIADSGATLVITADVNLRGPKVFPLKEVVDEALTKTTSVKDVIVLKRGASNLTQMQSPRDKWWHEVVTPCSSDHTAVPVDAEDTLFILYTSGSTGRPKGVVHSTGGYMVYSAYTFANVFQYTPGDVYFCSADIGWITGHSYIVYGPLLVGATVVMFEGVPTHPHPGRFWEIIDKHHVQQFYTAPTAIRSLQGYGLEPLEQHSLKSLKTLGTVGEPINEDAWRWYHTHVGKGRCPIVDTWWQTETGGVMISALSGITPTKPTCASLPLPGVQPILVDDDGRELLGNGVEGNLCINFPWPGMLRTTYGDHERFRQTYYERFPGRYFTGDGAKRDEDGYYRILGRVDDVINVSGHRLGTAEIENALNEHPRVVESAVVGYPHHIKGQAIGAFIVCDLTYRTATNLVAELTIAVTNSIGAIARPELIHIVPALPKTRSGKIMRRILRGIMTGQRDSFGDTSTLLDPTVVQMIIQVVDTIDQ